MKYIFRESTTCYVDFYREVEADSIEEAKDLHDEGFGDSKGCRVLDMIDCRQSEIVDSLPEYILD